MPLSEFKFDQPIFNLDFSGLEYTDVLENFDFDSFLHNTADADTSATEKTGLLAEISYTISEDLADGKLAQKDRDLRLLLKSSDSPLAAAKQAEKGSNSHQGATWDLYPTRILQPIRQVPAIEADCVHSSFRGVMEAPPLPQSHSNKKRKVGWTKANAATYSGRTSDKQLSQKFEEVSANLSHCFSSLFTR